MDSDSGGHRDPADYRGGGNALVTGAGSLPAEEAAARPVWLHGKLGMREVTPRRVRSSDEFHALQVAAQP